MTPAPGSSAPRRVRVRRIALRVVVLLLLGTVVNVAVAWWCAYKLSPVNTPIVQTGWVDWCDGIWHFRRRHCVGFSNTTALQAYDSNLRDWALSKLSVEGVLGHDQLIDSENLPRWSAYSRTGSEARFSQRSLREEWINGWPLLCIRFDHTADREKNSRVYTEMVLLGSVRLPFGIYWPGFAINTFFYAATLWLLFAAPGRVRRWRRIRRGMCVKCAYPVGASDVCTECGDHVNEKMRARGSMGLPPPATPAPGTGSEPVT
jgi:hypothetical protein